LAGPGWKTSPAVEGIETIGRSVPIRVIRVIRGFLPPAWLRLTAALEIRLSQELFEAH
jgi:hypothetical protein